ncbi:GDSL lipase/esterase [Dillenia turbinata]|uniref:GDSL lipase/esterase n=1 Tax=Dillenia turbinata TaxID=194707 RepID=A0AAN8V6B0_9MAGN
MIEGARFFWLHNTGPIGCLPDSVICYHPKGGNLDRNGCLRPENEVAQEFNKQLKDSMSQLRTQYPDAAFTYVDLYKAKYAIISGRKQLGFDDPMKLCCGCHYGYNIDCGKEEVVNGTVYGNPCPNRAKGISWDGIHYSEAANLCIAARLFNGTLSNPPIPLRYACHK